jgi:glucosamine--fructose-6-phosphate aminotransferase (isomerizing)
VIPHLIEKHYKGDLERAVEAALEELEGSYAIIVVAEYEHQLIAARRGSPLIIGIGDGEYLVASDVPAVLNYTDRIIYLEDGDLAAIDTDSIRITNSGVEVERKEQKTLWNMDDIQKTGYEHFMLKEIHEQPKVVQASLDKYVLTGAPGMEAEPFFDLDADNLSIIACGTSYNACLIGQYVIEELLGIPVRVELASELAHRQPIASITKIIGITQSGETADVLTAMRKMKDGGIKTVAITNVPGSSISRVADQTFYTGAGPEVGVAATKTFIAQIMILYQIALSHHGLNSLVRERLIAELEELPAKIQKVLDNKHQIEKCARHLSGYDNAFFIARGINVPIAMEGALKLKEISYIHAEGYAAGELKHGPFALLSPETPVIAIMTHDGSYGTMLTSVKEVQARKSPVFALTDERDDVIGEMADYVIKVPSASSLFTPVINTVALQLLAYYTAKYRDCPIDFPRNLAKSVTVE